MRLPSGGRVDRNRALRFRFNGADLVGLAGDTLASALLANGVRTVATSVTCARPRGIVAAGSEEPSALVQVDAPFPEPMQLATTIELYDGFAGSSLSGQGRLADRPDPARYDATNAHCDVLVVGGGAAGVMAALDAAGSGARVILADERGVFGGWTVDVGADLSSIDIALAELSAAPDVRVLARTTVFGYHDDNYLLAVERRTNHLGAAAPAATARERLWRIRAREVLLATGAHERLIAFANNDLPGVMLAGAARAYVNRYAVRPGSRAVVFTNNDSAYPAAVDLAAAGVAVAAVVDVRKVDAHHAGLPVLSEHEVVAATGDGRVEHVEVAGIGGGPSAHFDVDLLAVSGGWNPAVHLFSQGGGATRWDERISAFVPSQARQRVTVIGAARGEGLDPVEPFWASGSADPAISFVDLQRDVTIGDLRRATGAGLRSIEHVKRYTTAGTGHDQGRTSGVLTCALVAESLDSQIAQVGTTTYRGPYTPVAFATLAGRNIGDLLDPIRVTSIHDVHVELGAEFENVGQWKRPRCYPRQGEDMTAAVLRECAAARTGVAYMDASTLGKIDVQGPDAPAFLDLIYTNLMSTLKVGSIRYGAMCRADGMIFDDGTVLRVAEDHYSTTTTTGNAAAVLDWMEEWLQTEWPHLRVHCTSVTEQWATIAVVGPWSRNVVGTLVPDLALDNQNFPFMTWRDALVAGLPARLARISFSGELAYELNVSWSAGRALWQAVSGAGQPYGITPYGTETMHVLRAEKGYPIIGQDTDGTVTPQDLGMDWVVSKKKPDFIGKRSFVRAENLRADRKHLVGLLPLDRDELLREGTQLIESAEIPAPPVPMLGHVTSSYRSAFLGRTFALALVRSGRDRIGSHIYAAFGSGTVPVEVTSPVLVDPEGARRDG
jgi:sarcosine oxidase subunit alpha